MHNSEDGLHWSAAKTIQPLLLLLLQLSTPPPPPQMRFGSAYKFTSFLFLGHPDHSKLSAHLSPPVARRLPDLFRLRTHALLSTHTQTVGTVDKKQQEATLNHSRHSYPPIQGQLTPTAPVNLSIVSPCSEWGPPSRAVPECEFTKHPHSPSTILHLRGALPTTDQSADIHRCLLRVC